MNEDAAIRIVIAGSERLDDVEPLWLALRAHHAAVAANVVPMRTADESWRRRRAQYVEWLAGARATLLFAEDATPVGYLMLLFDDAPPTWDLGERIAEIESLSVLPASRGRGAGALLIAAARRIALEAGAGALTLSLVHTNETAHRFYLREGFKPFNLTMFAPLVDAAGAMPDGERDIERK